MTAYDKGLRVACDHALVLFGEELAQVALAAHDDRRIPHDVREEDVAVLLVALLEEVLLVACHLEAHAFQRTQQGMLRSP